jgi:hypothetical protein
MILAGCDNDPKSWIVLGQDYLVQFLIVVSPNEMQQHKLSMVNAFFFCSKRLPSINHILVCNFSLFSRQMMQTRGCLKSGDMRFKVQPRSLLKYFQMAQAQMR